jgi:hypothetical protein
MNDTSDRSPNDINVLMDFDSPWEAVIPSLDAENNFISGLGILFDHYIAIPNVLWEDTQGDIRRSFGEEGGNQFGLDQKFAFIENNFVYKYAGQVWGIFQGNTKDFRDLANGLYSESGAFVTFNRYYRNCDKYITMAEFDKLIPSVSGEQFFSVNWEKTVANSVGRNRLQYRAVKITNVIDTRGVEYVEGKDFVNDCGDLVWLNTPDASRPGINPKTGKGYLIAVRYTYKPWFYVKFLAHDVRISRSFDSVTGDYESPVDENGHLAYRPGPMAANIVSEYVFRDQRTVSDEFDSQIQEGDDNEGPR